MAATPDTIANAFDHITLINITKAAIVIVVGFIVAKIVSFFVNRVGSKHLSEHHVLLFRRICFYTIFILFFLSALQQLGFKLSVLLGAAGIFTVAIGFASQTSASNFISGLFLIFEKPFAVGDSIVADGESGSVISIDSLSVKLRTADNRFVRIPNEYLIKNKIINNSKYSTRRYDLVIGIGYKENIDDVTKLLLEVAAKNKIALKSPEPQVYFIGFADSAINLQFSVWANRTDLTVLKNSLASELKQCFSKNNIEIPYPYQTLCANEPIPVAIKND